MKQVIIINRKKYATGLFWQPVDPLVVPYIYARQLAAKGNKKYNLLTEYKSMVGLADSHDGPRAGMYVAASVVTDALSSFISFLGVFHVDNGYYLIAVRNGIIIRDVALETENEARKQYAELSNMPDWNGLFAPASWGMPRSQEKLLSELVKKDSGTRLRQMSIIKSMMPSIIIAVVFLIVIISFLYSPLFGSKNRSRPTQLTPEMAAIYQQQIKEKNEQLDREFKIEKKSIVYPYEKIPNVMERARLCYKAIAFMMQPVVGWNQRNVSCDKSHVYGIFARDFGTLNDFYVVGADLMPGGVVTQKSENDISVSVKLPELQSQSSIDERDQETAMRDIVSIFQQVEMRADVRVANETIKNGEKRENVNAIEVSAISKLIPMEFIKILADFGGVYIKSVDWDAGSRDWSYKVLIYTK